MNPLRENPPAKRKFRIQRFLHRHPVLLVVIVVTFFYLTDCLAAHQSHPNVPWIESGIYCGGPFGFLATICVAIAGIWFLARKGY
jgi:hypothetical protein